MVEEEEEEVIEELQKCSANAGKWDDRRNLAMDAEGDDEEWRGKWWNAEECEEGGEEEEEMASRVARRTVMK